MRYSEKETIKRVEEALQSPKFYDNNFVNWKGVTDTGKRYSEVISAILLQKEGRSRLDMSIPQITRQGKSYFVGHEGKPINGRPDGKLKRQEEYMALGMFKKTFKHFGEIIDYQTPVINKQNEGIGDIDLLSYDGNCLHILELKKNNEDDTLLRCALQVYTYWKTVNHKKLLDDFGKPNYTKVRKGILICKNCLAYKDFKNIAELPKTKRLVEELGVDVYVYEEKDGDIIVEVILQINP